MTAILSLCMTVGLLQQSVRLVGCIKILMNSPSCLVFVYRWKHWLWVQWVACGRQAAGWWQLRQDTPPHHPQPSTPLPPTSRKQQISAAAIKTRRDNTIKRKPDTGTIRQSETVLVLSAVQRLDCLTEQTTMPRAEITGNASLSERGRNRERWWESLMGSTLFTDRPSEQNSGCVRYIKKNLLFTRRYQQARFFSQRNVFAEHAKWINQIKAQANPSLS